MSLYDDIYYILLFEYDVSGAKVNHNLYWLTHNDLIEVTHKYIIIKKSFLILLN